MPILWSIIIESETAPFLSGLVVGYTATAFGLGVLYNILGVEQYNPDAQILFHDLASFALLSVGLGAGSAAGGICAVNLYDRLYGRK